MIVNTRMQTWEQIVGRAGATFPGIGRANGYLVPILGKTEFRFDGRSSGATQEIPVATGVNSSSWVSGVLLVRNQGKNTWSTTATLSVAVRNIMLVEEEPDVVYAASSDLVSLSFQEVPADAAPLLKIATIPAPIGPMLQVLVRWSQGATALTGAAFQSVQLGIDLVGRPA